MNQRFCNGMIHVIKPGDNLYQLSRRYRVPLALILRANPYVDVYNLRPGQEICIPMSRPSRPIRGPEPRDNQMESRYEDGDHDRDDYEPNDRENSVEMEECAGESCAYRSDGTKSLGKILEETGLSMAEFFERNNPDQVIIASDVLLDVPKKV